MAHDSFSFNEGMFGPGAGLIFLLRPASSQGSLCINLCGIDIHMD
jgi:hypothetical protein